MGNEDMRGVMQKTFRCLSLARMESGETPRLRGDERPHGGCKRKGPSRFANVGQRRKKQKNTR